MIPLNPDQHKKVCDELMRIAGHELKNPLTAFSLQNHLLRQTLAARGMDEDLEAMDLIARTESHVFRMEKLLDRMIWLVDTHLRDGIR